jgi:hypothetical protein
MVKINSTKLRVEIESWKRSSKSFLEAYKRERRNINVREQKKKRKKERGYKPREIWFGRGSLIWLNQNNIWFLGSNKS